MKSITLRFFALAMLTLAGNAIADPVTFQIGPYAGGGYSASWLHHATHCSGSTGAHTGATLYMCDGNAGDNNAITGSLSGDYDSVSGILTIASGQLDILGMGSYLITGGSLGGAFDDGTAGLAGLNWFIDVDTLGSFFFEDVGMGPAGPNGANGTEIILWGQNTNAYCHPSTCSSDRWGIDLYGKIVDVPEPAPLALLAIGLLSMGAMHRRRIKATA